MGSFMEDMARTFGTRMVSVVHNAGQHDEVRHDEVEALVQQKSAMFAVDAPVHEGDRLELPDPRGGIRTLYVTHVKITEVGDVGDFGPDLDHIEAAFRDSPPQPTERAQHVYGDQYVITGSNGVNIVTRGGTLNQTATPGYEELAQRIQQVLDVLNTTGDLDEEEREVGRDAASTALDELVQPEPNQRVVKGALAALRGVLGSAANAGAGAAASGLVGQLFLS